MLDLVVDGYYKSMTSVFYRAIRDTGKLILYEPLSPGLSRGEIAKEYHPLHGLKVWDSYLDDRFVPYLQQFKEIHTKIRERIGGDLTPVEFEDVREFFDFVHSLPFECSIQPNNCHFILDDIYREYGSKIIFLLRNPVETWISFVLEPPFDIKGFAEKYAKRKITAIMSYAARREFLRFKNSFTKYPIRFFTLNFAPKNERTKDAYFLERRYKILQKFFDISMKGDWLDAFLEVYVLSNYHGYENAKRSDGVIVYYEALVNHPLQVYEFLTRERNIPLSRKRFETISNRFRTTDRYLYERFEDRIKDLGLWSKYKQFYDWRRYALGGVV